MWYEWHQSDLPCVFDQERASQNTQFLDRLFASVPQLYESARRDGPLQKDLRNKGCASFIGVNWLAEDLRLLTNVDGFSSILRDLVDIRQCLPTWHTLHTAALFERARRGAVLRFIEPSTDNSKSPDFLVQIEAEKVPVEAKLLAESEEEESFTVVAKPIVSEIARIPMPPNTLTTIVLKADVSAELVRPVLEFATPLLSTYNGGNQAHRGQFCNVLIEPLDPEIAKGCSPYGVISPVPDKENIRVVRRARDASRQLRSLSAERPSGILSLGLHPAQTGGVVAEQLHRAVRGGRLSGIAAVIFNKRAIRVTPPCRTTVDLLEVRYNTRANAPIDKVIPLRPFDYGALLTKAEPLFGIPAFTCYEAVGTNGYVFVPKVKPTAEMFA